jgi:antitoxin VapB
MKVYTEILVALSIKDPETDRLARALADATGESITEAIRRALEERLARESERVSYERMRTDVRRVQERLAGLPVLDPSNPDDLIDYDEHGLPK